MKITLVQCRQYWEDKEANLQHLDTLLTSVKSTDLILLPEMFHTGFSMNVRSLAEDLEGSLAIQWLKNKALEINTAIYTSFICRQENQVFNRGTFVYPNGEILFYDKRKLFSFAQEDNYFSAGEKEQIIEYKGFKLSLSICYDLRFPEMLRNRMVNDGESHYDILLNVANWPQRRSLHWKTLLQARAIENQCFIVGVNRVGTDNSGLEYSGDSAVIDPYGNYLTTILPGKESVTTVEIEKEMIHEIRKKMNFLKDFE